MEDEILSSTAEEVISGMTVGVLCPAVFIRFIKATYRKHKRRVLSILESCTSDEDGAKRQLSRLKQLLREAHRNYIAEQRKNAKLRRRVSKLILIIEREEANERPERRGRRYIERDNIVNPMDNEIFSSEVAEIINGMVDGPMTPERLKTFLKETHKKCKTQVLDILRSFPEDSTEVKRKLLCLKNSLLQLRAVHQDYMEEHRKDSNLDKRLARLIAIIGIEQRRGRRSVVNI